MPDYDRFRSFAERYIVARAHVFRPGFEREDAWMATLDAKTIYQNVARAAKDAEPEPEAANQNAQQAGAGTLQPGAASPPINTYQNSVQSPRTIKPASIPPPGHPSFGDAIKALVEIFGKKGTPANGTKTK
jgi:hypothetical protein